MEAAKIDPPKITDMVTVASAMFTDTRSLTVYPKYTCMCGDHSVMTKAELHVKDQKLEDKEKERDRLPMSQNRIISPTTSRTLPLRRTPDSPSEHCLRVETKRRVRSLEAMQRSEIDAAPGNKALVQAALGSFRWPPYLLGVWVCVLVLTHVLHCLVSLLERALPNLKKFCHYFRQWTEETWGADSELNHRIYPVGLAFLTGLLYILYFGLYAAYSIALWSIEPLCSDGDEKPDGVEPKVTNYIDEVKSKISVRP